MTVVASGAPVRVGIIGASTSGWARTAHLPAIASIPGMEVTAVSTTRLESARATAEEFGVPRAYNNPHDLIHDDQVDLVLIAVRVEHHAALLDAVLESGKPVYCEWPAGSTLEQTRRLRDAFADAGQYAVPGLQARSRPEVRYLREALAEGLIGRILSTTLVGEGSVWGSEIDPGKAYLQDDERGGTMTTIPFGHTIDALAHVLGEFTSISAMTAIRRPIVRLADSDQTLPRTTPDQVLMAGQLSDGVMVSAHYRGGDNGGLPLLWEITGSEGTVTVTAPNGNLQLSPLTLSVTDAGSTTARPLTVPAHYRKVSASLSQPAAGVAESLFVVEQDLRTGSHDAPTFDDAVSRKSMLAALRRAADTGVSQLLDA